MFAFFLGQQNKLAHVKKRLGNENFLRKNVNHSFVAFDNKSKKFFWQILSQELTDYISAWQLVYKVTFENKIKLKNFFEWWREMRNSEGLLMPWKGNRFLTIPSLKMRNSPFAFGLHFIVMSCNVLDWSNLIHASTYIFLSGQLQPVANWTGLFAGAPSSANNLLEAATAAAAAATTTVCSTARIKFNSSRFASSSCLPCTTFESKGP